MTSNPWKVRAKKASSPEYADPIKLQAGDLVELVGKEDDGWIWCRHRAGKEGWVPLSYLTAVGEGNTRAALCDYEATELPVEVGEEFQIAGGEGAGCGGQIRREHGDGYAWSMLNGLTRGDRRGFLKQ